jgi:hypothetical protein
MNDEVFECAGATQAELLTVAPGDELGDLALDQQMEYVRHVTADDITLALYKLPSDVTESKVTGCMMKLH